jgi:integrase
MTTQATLEKTRKLKRTKAEQKRYDKFGAGKSSWRIWFEYLDADGNPQMITTTKGLNTETDAIRLLASLETQEKNQVGIFAPTAPTKPEKLTFRRYVEDTYFPQLLDSTMESAHSGKKSEIKLLINYFGDTLLEDIDEDACLKFKKHIENLPVVRQHKIRLPEKSFDPITKRYSYQYDYEMRETPRAVSTANHYLKRLQGILNKAYRKKKMPERIDFENFVDTANEAKREVVISFEQHHALLNACTGIRAHLRLVLIGLFETGARLSELKGITKKDVNLETQFAYALNSKRRKRSKPTYRKIYISNYLKNALLENGFEKLADDDFVFVQGNHKNSWSKAKRDALENLTAADRKLFDASLTMKDLRHTAYSNYIQSGINETIADRQIAHSLSEKITRKVYGNNLSDDYVFTEFQKYERYSEKMRREADLPF